MRRIAFILILVLSTSIAYAKAPKGWHEGRIVPGESADSTTLIYLEDGTSIQASSPDGVFAKLLHHWSKHPDRTEFYYKLGARYNGLQEITIDYFTNPFGGARLSGTYAIASAHPATQ